MKITVAGVGYVGLSLAVLLAQNHEVTAITTTEAKAEKLNRFISPSQDDEIERFFEEARAGERELHLAAETRLDLRGMLVDDCLIELDRFIDQAIRSGVTDFTVVHGKGTGALRTAVRQYLKKSPYVKTSRPGVYGEGEDGVTIVTLK